MPTVCSSATSARETGRQSYRWADIANPMGLMVCERVILGSAGATELDRHLIGHPGTPLM